MTNNNIVVLALNPALDVGYELPQLIADRKVAADKTYYHPGGNGINISRGLAELGMPLQCGSVLGGVSGDVVLRLLGDSLGENHRIFTVDDETRLNVTLLQQNPPGQYEVDSRGPEIPAQLLDEITEWVLENSASGYTVLSGSLPPGVPDNYYRRLAESIRGQGGRAVVEAHGAVLTEVLEASPWLLRLNQYALEMSINRRMESIEDIAAAARELQQRGIETVCISLGGRGAVLVDADGSYHCSAPRVRVHSTVGCGDSLVAGLVTAASRGGDAGDMLRLGVTCGSATASHPGTELFTRAEIEDSNYELELTTLDL
jgi:6-phosphofructokinase 2